jgi:hypothetical protein
MLSGEVRHKKPHIVWFRSYEKIQAWQIHSQSKLMVAGAGVTGGAGVQGLF